MSDANAGKDGTTPKKGGFGAFSQQYRDRWAAKHPDAKKAPVDGVAGSTPPPPSAPTDAGPKQ